MALNEYRIRMRVWFAIVAFGREWVVYSLPDMPGEWSGFRLRLAWARA